MNRIGDIGLNKVSINSFRNMDSFVAFVSDYFESPLNLLPSYIRSLYATSEKDAGPGAYQLSIEEFVQDVKRDPSRLSIHKEGRVVFLPPSQPPKSSVGSQVVALPPLFPQEKTPTRPITFYPETPFEKTPVPTDDRVLDSSLDRSPPALPARPTGVYGHRDFRPQKVMFQNSHQHIVIKGCRLTPIDKSTL